MNLHERDNNINEAELRLAINARQKNLEDKKGQEGLDIWLSITGAHALHVLAVNLRIPNNEEENKKAQLGVIEEDKKAIFKYDWAPGASAVMAGFNEEKILLENPGIDKDMATSKAFYEEFDNMNKGIYKIPKDLIFVYQEVKNRFKDEAKSLEKKSLKKQKEILRKPKETIFDKLKNLVR